MFAALELANCIRKALTGKEGKAVGYLAAALGTVDGILLVLALADVITVYDTALYWAPLQGMIFLILTGLCISQYRRVQREKRMLLASGISLLSVTVLELVNGRMNWWTSGIMIKVVFVLLFVCYFIRTVKLVAVNHQASAKAKELAGELRNSRIVLAMSQIRTHFIFNVLTAISGMCEYDPQKADETLIRFSRYLRSNIDIMEEDEPEPFLKSMEHLEDYIVLEQLRFGNKLRFVKRLEVTDFMIPPLILQPVVENSIKHGLLPKPSGGTIELHTKKESGNIIITITDDGVGYDTKADKREGAVGMNNVCFRLKHMVDGRMEVESRAGEGTRVTMFIPCREE